MAQRAGLTRREAIQANALLKHLESRDESEAFRYPVDYYRMGLADYPAIIKKPMDLSSIQRKVTAGKYKAFKDFLADVQLVWDNCRKYNKAKSPIYQSAEAMQAITASFLEHYVDPEEVHVPVVNESLRVSFDEKIDLITQLRELQPAQLSQVVKLLETEAPDAVERIDTDRVKLWVNRVGRAPLGKVQVFVRESLHEAEPVKKQKKSE